MLGRVARQNQLVHLSRFTPTFRCKAETVVLNVSVSFLRLAQKTRAGKASCCVHGTYSNRLRRLLRSGPDSPCGVRTLTVPLAIRVSVLSAAPSSSSVFCSRPATSYPRSCGANVRTRAVAGHLVVLHALRRRDQAGVAAPEGRPPGVIISAPSSSSPSSPRIFPARRFFSHLIGTCSSRGDWPFRLDEVVGRRRS